MKIKLISICLALVLITVLGACGKQTKISDDMTPTQTAEAFLDSFKAQDWDTLGQLYAGDGSDFRSAFGSEEDSDEATNTLRDAFLSRLYDFDYKITGETIDEDQNTATVDLTITTYNMVEVFNNFYQAYMNQALDKYSGKSGDMNDEDLEKMAVTILDEQLQDAKKDFVSDTSLSMTKTDGRWIVDEAAKDDPEFLNALSGGMMDVASDIVNAREGEDEDK